MIQKTVKTGKRNDHHAAHATHYVVQKMYQRV